MGRSCCEFVGDGTSPLRGRTDGSDYRISPAALATQSVLLVSASTTYQAPFALSVASSVRYEDPIEQCSINF